jgi:hypothetical protein
MCRRISVVVGALPVPDGDRIVPMLNRYLADAVERGTRIYASRD